MSKPRPDPTLLHEIAKCMKKAFRDHNLSVPEAARMLGVKRQTVWLYLNEKSMPGGNVLRKACRLWDLSLTVKGFTFTKEAFGRDPRPEVEQKQNEFPFAALDSISPDQIEARAISRLDGFELRIRVRAAS